MTRVRFVLVCVALILTFNVVGCKKGEPVVPVSGVATYQGEPLAYCSVFFTPTNVADPNLCITSVGLTDAEGRFKLTTTELNARPGAVVGTHKVAFKFMQWGTEGVNDEEYPDTSDLPLLAPEYTNGSKITFDVPPKGTDAANFNLE